jgi:hypothetical protein
MSVITDTTKLKEDIPMPIPNLRGIMGNRSNALDNKNVAQGINKAVKLMHKHAGIRKGRQSI